MRINNTCLSTSCLAVSTLAIKNLCTPTVRRCVRRKRKRYRRVWNQRKLPYHLVQRCYRRGRHRPPGSQYYNNRFRRDWCAWKRQQRVNAKGRRRYKQAKQRRFVDRCIQQFNIITTPPKFTLSAIDQCKLSSFCTYIDPTRPLSVASSASSFRWKTCNKLATIDEEIAVLGERVLNACTLMEKGSFDRFLEVAATLDGNTNFSTLPLVNDSGASSGVTPYRADFIDYQECDIEVSAVDSTTKVIGIRTAMYKFYDPCTGSII
ncbi:hypothetical protein ACHAXS_002622 [Conticribra weissflogii]